MRLTEKTMALKDILVHVDNSQGCASRLEAAFELARSHGAHLTGFFVNTGTMLPTIVEASAGPELIKELEDSLRSQANQAEKLFKQISDNANVVAEWHYAEGEVAQTINRHARTVDLVIMSQGDGDDPRPITGGLAVKILLESGRPVLLIPYLGASKPIGERILVAWNTCREAVRAVNDALPILERAKHVYVLTINPPPGETGKVDIPSADICLHLARHGVHAEAQSVQAKDIEVGDQLLSRATAQDVDLIVMGAYGHSRLREIVLSGATRHILAHMNVPIFLSH